MKKQENKRQLGPQDIAITIFFLLLSTFLIVGYIRGNTIADLTEESLETFIENAGDMIDCEIKYKDFSFSGLCTEKEEVMKTMKTIYGIMPNKESLLACEDGCYMSFDKVKYTDNTAGINGFMRNDCLKICLEKYT